MEKLKRHVVEKHVGSRDEGRRSRQIADPRPVF